MDRESVERLRFDRRLLRRRDRLAEADFAAYVESLPDVSDKLTRGGGDDREGPSASSAGGAPEPAGGVGSPGLGAEDDPSGSGGRSTPS